MDKKFKFLLLRKCEILLRKLKTYYEQLKNKIFELKYLRL